MVERHADLIMQWVGMEQATNFEFTNFEFTNFDSPLISLMGQGSFHLSVFKNKFTNDARYLKKWHELQKITHLILSKTFIFQSYTRLLQSSMEFHEIQVCREIQNGNVRKVTTINLCIELFHKLTDLISLLLIRIVGMRWKASE